MDPSEIKYHHAGVADLASNVGTAAAQLIEIHDDVLQRTQALAEFFSGEAATHFFDAQSQALRGLEGLISTVGRHGQTVTQVHQNAINTDLQSANLFM